VHTRLHTYWLCGCCKPANKQDCCADAVSDAARGLSKVPSSTSSCMFVIVLYRNMDIRVGYILRLRSYG